MKTRSKSSASPHSPSFPPLPDGDLAGDYIVWLEPNCPVHSVAIAGIDIPKHIDVQDHVCPTCSRRFLPAALPALCPSCSEPTLAKPDLHAAPRRMKRRVKLSDAQLREIWTKLDPERKVVRDPGGRILEGPRMVPTATGERLLAPYVKWLRVDDVLNEPESIEQAVARRQNLRRLANLAERLATDTGLTATQRQKYAGQVAELSAALGLAPDSNDNADSTASAADAGAAVATPNSTPQPTARR